MIRRLKLWWFGFLGKDPDAVIVCFRSGDRALADAMCAEVRRLEPDRRIFEVTPEEPLDQVRARFRGYRIGLAPALLASAGTGDGREQAGRFRAMRRAAFFLAPRKILAYNGRLERHHLKLSTPIASWLFLRGLPLDRIYLRPSWLCPWKRDRTVRPSGHRVIEGRARDPKQKSVAVLTPYFPYPLSHGGAVRMFNLLRETAREFDIVVYAFTEGLVVDQELAPVLAFVSRVHLVEKPRYREPRWSTLRPPEVCEYRSPEMARLIGKRDTDLLQTEYTYLAPYGGDILVEHDVTFDLFQQVLARHSSLSAWWNWWRWFRFERRAIETFQRVVVMSPKDRAMVGAARAVVIENGVDTARFEPRPETTGPKLLFIGSFRHFPNIVAFRFLTEAILPLLSGPERDFELTVVAGPEPWLHWRNHTGTLRPPDDPRIKLLEFVADVRPLYHDANVVVVPTLESAGTNVKVLEAMAMERAVVSTSSGCARLGLEHGINVWIADDPVDFAAAIGKLLGDDELRAGIAKAGRAQVEKRFDWRAIGLRQRALFRELLGDAVQIRAAEEGDLDQIAGIQKASPEAAQWDPAIYLTHDCLVASEKGRVHGFLVSRQTAPGEHEILNLAIDPLARRRRLAQRLVETAVLSSRGQWFLEVRESNGAAIRLYESLGFEQRGVRENYYSNPAESGIVMRFFS